MLRLHLYIYIAYSLRIALLKSGACRCKIALKEFVRAIDYNCCLSFQVTRNQYSLSKFLHLRARKFCINNHFEACISFGGGARGVRPCFTEDSVTGGPM
jgi:hypothetical protein